MLPIELACQRHALEPLDATQAERSELARLARASIELVPLSLTRLAAFPLPLSETDESHDGGCSEQRCEPRRGKHAAAGRHDGQGRTRLLYTARRWNPSSACSSSAC